MKLTKENKKEVMLRLKQWKYCETMLNKLQEGQNVILTVNNQITAANKAVLLHFLTQLKQAFISLDETEYQIIQYFYHDGWSDDAIMNELYLNRTTYYDTKRKAMNKIILLTDLNDDEHQ